MSASLRRLSHTAALGAAAVALASGPARIAEGQAAWIDHDLFGYPIAIIDTGPLQPDQYYEVRVHATPAPVPYAAVTHPVVSIRSAADLTGVNIGGADGCFTPHAPLGFAGTCVRFRVPHVPMQSWSVWIRAWATGYEGLADVELFTVADAMSAVTSSATPLTPSGAVSFGGVIHPDLGDAASSYQFETTEAVGSPQSSHVHIIMFSPSQHDPATDHFLFRGLNGSSGLESGYIGSHRSGARGTAQYTGPLPQGTDLQMETVIAGPIDSTGAGALRLLRNDCVDGSPSCGSPGQPLCCPETNDADHDTLGRALEALLGTCDAESDADSFHGSPPCSSRTGCSGTPTTEHPYSASLCQQSMRDTDGDGYRDDLELYGFGTMDLPVYGASPSHYDVFGQMNYVTTADASASCASLQTGGLYTPARALGVAEQYRHHASLGNRDGVLGIAFHIDTQFDLRHEPAPSPFDTRAGDWGGSTCYVPTPACTTNADCVGGGTCCTDPGGCAGTLMGRCVTWNSNSYQLSITGDRGWAFRTLAMGGGCNAAGGLYSMLTNGCSSFGASSQEIGHMAGENHGGPERSRIGGAEGNYSRVYHSRMNYAFQDFGHTVTLDEPNADSARVSFSPGVLPSVDAFAAYERCPLGSDGDAYALMRDAFDPTMPVGPPDLGLRVGPEFPVGHVCTTGGCLGPDGCPAVDWDEDGQLMRDGETTAGPLLSAHGPGGYSRIMRAGVFGLGEDAPPYVAVSETGSQIVVAGTSLMRFRVEGSTDGTPQLVVSETIAGGIDDAFHCRVEPTDPVAPLDRELQPERYPHCRFDTGPPRTLSDEHGAPIAALAVAAATTQVFYGNLARPVVVVVWVPLPTRPGEALSLRFGLYYQGGNWTPSPEPIPVGSGLPALRPMGDRYEGIPALARIHGSDEVSLVYHDANGEITELVASVAQRGVTWTAGATIVPEGGARFVASPGITTFAYVGTFEGAMVVIGAEPDGTTQIGGPVPRGLRIYVRAPYDPGWVLLENVVDSDAQAYGVLGRPYLLLRTWPQSGPVPIQRLELSYRAWDGAPGATLFRVSARNTVSTWRPVEHWALDERAGAAPVTLALDDRPGIDAPSGVRGEWDWADEQFIVDNCTNTAPPPAGMVNCPTGSRCRPLTTAPSRMVCVPSLASGVDPLLVNGRVTLPPGADGLVPYTAEDFNDWEQFAWGFCRSLRAEMARRGPARYRESAGDNVDARIVAAVASCPAYDYY